MLTTEDKKRKVLNNHLKWDNHHLGQYQKDAIISKWHIEGDFYHTLDIDNGIIHCIIEKQRNLFPCIVEDIKDIFGIWKRGILRITLSGEEYLLYYVPVNLKGEVIYETKLSHLDCKNDLRKNIEFRKKVTKLLAFCEILSIAAINETTIRIRPSVNGEYLPIGYNHKDTTLSKYQHKTTLNKTLFLKWFGESSSISDVLCDMVFYNKNNLTSLISDIRKRIDEIIYKYDKNYIWYSCFIIEHLSNHLAYST
jgi:hypothetical protein